MKCPVYFQLTDKGKVRVRNEDCLLASIPDDPSVLDKKGAFFAVADGLGGLADGEVASRTAVDSAGAAFERLETFEGPDWLWTVIAQANLAIRLVNNERPPERWMATTLTLCLFHGGTLFIGHVGDCRVYRVRDGRAEALTRDHALDRHTLTRSVGIDASVEPDLLKTEIRAGDVYVPCSDGLHSVVGPEEIQAAVSSFPPAGAAKRLVDLANERGGPDNITLQVIQIV